MGALCLGTVSTAGAQTAEQKASARAFAEKGADAFEAERWEEAVDWFERAERLVHAPTHLLYLARAQQKLGRLVEARETYMALRRETLPETTPTIFAQAQASGEQEFSQLDPLVPYLTVQVTGPGASEVEVSIDDKPIDAALVGAPRPINPGTYTVRARSKTGESQPQEVTIAASEKKEITLELLPRAASAPVTSTDAGTSSSGPNIPAYVALGVGAVGVGVGVVFLVDHLSQSSAAQKSYDDCVDAGRCSEATMRAIDDRDSAAATSGTISFIGFGVGAAAIGTGIVLLLLDGGEPAQPTTGTTIRPYVGFDRVGFTGTF